MPRCTDGNCTMELIAVTMGDAAGIGPEIVVKTFADAEFVRCRPAFVIGDAGILRRQVTALGVALEIVVVKAVSDVAPPPGMLEVLTVSELPADLSFGKVDARAGKAAFDSIRKAIDLAMGGEIAGICTAPIHKEAFAAAAVPYPGHTEMLAAFFGTHNYAMMLVNSTLPTIIVTV